MGSSTWSKNLKPTSLEVGGCHNEAKKIITNAARRKKNATYEDGGEMRRIDTRDVALCIFYFFRKNGIEARLETRDKKLGEMVDSLVLVT